MGPVVDVTVPFLVTLWHPGNFTDLCRFKEKKKEIEFFFSENMKRFTLSSWKDICSVPISQLKKLSPRVRFTNLYFNFSHIGSDRARFCIQISLTSNLCLSDQNSLDFMLLKPRDKSNNPVEKPGKCWLYQVIKVNTTVYQYNEPLNRMH
jgi:hypothetical protein